MTASRLSALPTVSQAGSFRDAAAGQHICEGHADVNWVQFEDAPSAPSSQTPARQVGASVATDWLPRDLGH